MPGKETPSCRTRRLHPRRGPIEGSKSYAPTACGLRGRLLVCRRAAKASKPSVLTLCGRRGRLPIHRCAIEDQPGYQTVTVKGDRKFRDFIRTRSEKRVGNWCCVFVNCDTLLGLSDPLGERTESCGKGCCTRACLRGLAETLKTCRATGEL